MHGRERCTVSRGAQLNWIRFPLELYPYPEPLPAIQGQRRGLDSLSRARYLTMCVFPEDTLIPECVFQTFWRADQNEVQETADSWLVASLAP